MIFEVDAIDGLAEGSVGLDLVGGDGAAEVIGNEGGVACGVDGDVGGTCSGRGDLTDLVECAGFGVDEEGGGRCGGVVYGVDGVETAFGEARGGDG